MPEDFGGTTISPMTNSAQVISHVRLGLDQLSARNAQYEFEHLCWHLTRLRISEDRTL